MYINIYIALYILSYYWLKLIIAMIKANQFIEEESDIDIEYVATRNRDIVHIRKDNRESIFTKRRKGQDQRDRTADQTQQGTHQLHMHIIQPKFANQILGFLLDNYEKGQFRGLINDLNNQDALLKHRAIIGIRKILSICQPPPIQEAIDAGLVEIFLDICSDDEWPQLQLESAWALANIASGSSDQCGSIISAGGIRRIMKMLHTQVVGILQQVIWIAGNIASDSPGYRNRLIQEGAVKRMVKIATTHKDPYIIKSSTWCLSNLCRGVPLPIYQDVKPAIYTLCYLLGSGLVDDQQTFIDGCWAISYFSDSDKGRAEPVFQTNLLAKVIPLMQKSSQKSMIVPCLRIVGAISTGKEREIQVLMESNILDALICNLAHKNKTIKRQTCWVLSNLAASNFKHVNKLLENQQLIETLLRMFGQENEQTNREIAFIFGNMCYSAAKYIDLDLFYISYGIIQHYQELLESTTNKIVQDALETLGLILRLSQCRKIVRNEGVNAFANEMRNKGMVQLLQNLQYSKSDVIYDKVVYILTTYYILEDPLDGRYKPKIEDTQERPRANKDDDSENDEQIVYME